MTYNAHNFTTGAPINDYARQRRQQPLTLDQVRNIAPSAFATQPHDSRSNRYVYIPTVNVIEAMLKAGFAPYSATQSTARSEDKANFTKHMIRFRRPDEQMLYVGDSVLEVIVINSHDGSSCYELNAGLFRLACSNGLVVSEGMIASVHVRHKGDVIADVVNGSNQLVERAPKALQAINAWKQLQLSAPEQQAFAEAARTIRFADSEGKVETPITAAQLLTPRRSDDARNDLWATFNRVQENVTKGGLSARPARTAQNLRPRRVTTKAINGIDQDVKLNKALWTLTERMAEIKQAQ